MKVMVLYANAGNGHRRAAEALAAICEQDERFSEVRLIDALQYTNKVFVAAPNPHKPDHKQCKCAEQQKSGDIMKNAVHHFFRNRLNVRIQYGLQVHFSANREMTCCCEQCDNACRYH